jgi:NAD(P)-dependent dehydrogenase (short-subunit alcohol dehydrogenase family)
MSGELGGRHALVTGGGRGIGAAIATRLADGGAVLTLVGRDAARLDAAAAALPAGAIARAITCDITDATAVAAAFAAARERHGPIEILVNNAGQAGSAPLRRTDDELWQRMLAVNLTGTFLCTRAALPGMLAAGHGRIVNIASTAALRGYAYSAAYAAAKHGVLGLTRSLALEVARSNITVNAVCPGFSDTELVQQSIANVVAKTGRTPEEAAAEFTKFNPQGRLVNPAEVAETVAWLCSDGAAAITGQAVSVSGGEVM